MSGDAAATPYPDVASNANAASSGRPVRVLIVQAVGEVGGAEASLLTFLGTADRADLQPLVAVLRQGPLCQRLTELGVPWQVIPAGDRFRRLRRNAAVIWQLHRLARTWAADLVYSNGTYSHLFGGPAAWLARKPYVWRLCDMLLPRASRLYPLVPLIPAALTVTDSNAVAAQARRYSRRFRRLRTVYPGTPLRAAPATAESADVRRELGIPTAAPVVAVIGRLQRWKGQVDLLLAAPEILKSFPDTHFLVVGGTLFGLEQDYVLELRNLVTSLGIDANVHLTGHRADVPRILGTVDIVVVPSRLPEPFGTIQIEAMASGRPVVSTAAGGNPEVVEAGRTGLLVAPASPAELAGAVCTLLADAELRARMGREGRERVFERFTAERMTRDLLASFRAVLDMGASASQKPHATMTAP